jgi:hypothetical protein
MQKLSITLSKQADVQAQHHARQRDDTDADAIHLCTGQMKELIRTPSCIEKARELVHKLSIMHGASKRSDAHFAA